MVVRYNYLDSVVKIFIIILLLVNTFLSLAILLRNKKSRINQSYFSFVTLLDLWILTNFLENEVELLGVDNLALFLRLDFMFGVSFIYAWYIFCVYFTEFSRFKWVYKALFPVVLFLAISSFSPFLIQDISFNEGVIQFSPGILLDVYAGVVILCSVIGLALLLLAARKAKRDGNLTKITQIKWIFLGYVLSLGIAIFINLFLQPFYFVSLDVSRVGLYGMGFWVGLTAYAITRQRLFEIKIFIARAVALLMFLVSLAAIYLLILFKVTELLFGITLDTRVIITMVFITMIAIFSFQPLKKIIQKVTHKLFFKGDYDSDKLFSSLTRIMVETIDLEEMSEKITSILSRGMGIEKIAFAIIDQGKVSEVLGIGYRKLQADPEIEMLFHKPYPLQSNFVFDNLEDQNLKEIFRSRDISFAMPLKVRDDEVAVLIAGSKLSGEAFNEKDVNILTVFGAEAGIAIQNAKAYQKIKNFSKELELKVAERTKELEESQYKELAKAQEVAKLKDEFVFVAAHELRTPVTAIRGFLELVSEAMQSFPSDVRHHITSISEASEHLNQLVNDLLQVSRSDSGAMTISTSPIEIEPIVESLVKELWPLAQKRNISIDFKTKDSKIKAMTDTSKLSEVLMNILSNAVKYNRDNGVIDISIYGLNNQVMIEIKDTGYGIPKDQQDKIFQKFFRAGAKGTENTLGTGLGLFISKMLVEKMGGQIRFSSMEGEGTTFAVILPGVK